MSRINSNQKGKLGEREVASILREHGFEEARRSQQYAGINNDADVVGLPHMHIEVKRVERLNIHQAVEQAHEDKRESELGMVVHRKNHSEWLVTMTLEEWMEIYKKYLATEEEVDGGAGEQT